MPIKDDETVSTATHPQCVASSSAPQSLPTKITHTHRHTEQEKEEQCTGNTHSNCHHHQQKQQESWRVCCYSPRVNTHRATPAQKSKRRNAKNGTAAPRSTHALPQVVLLISPPTHPHITPHSRRILRRRIRNGRNAAAGNGSGRESGDTRPLTGAGRFNGRSSDVVQSFFGAPWLDGVRPVAAHSPPGDNAVLSMRGADAVRGYPHVAAEASRFLVAALPCVDGGMASRRITSHTSAIYRSRVGR
ncbi:hypothetical protein MOQ_007108 [Trypanosoma cruzi marinkellei]|uniref:Uncharacterized protein n=1 Tax=Trypanosoma cruzi marinkellei TaxID=85056 RepID=K2M2H4_TRYCR|nr:hypothetical protein MOQ_007108 [Trypanosoma cruzi marinkellei]